MMESGNAEEENVMPKVRVHNITVSLDGFAAGPHQRLDEPFGDNIEGLHDWMVAAMRDRADGKTGIHLSRR